MNLLSHFKMDSEHPSAYFKFGILLPDLITGFNRKIRNSVFANLELKNPEHAEILAGIKRHYALDAAFHQSEFFEKYSLLIKENLREGLQSLNHRAYFFAHIFLEMLIDRLLLKQFPDLPVQFYRNLNSLNLKTVSSYFVQIGQPDFSSEFFDTFTRFTEKEYLYHYLDNEMFVKALVRVFTKIIPLTPSPAEINYLKELTDFFENKHREELLDIFNVLDKKLNRAELNPLAA